ncbi:Dabb family protein [Mycobacterium aquaticum]|uniref:Stress-response A/B barrel domain-containing protein n=1 Tax=Mycobacterium aquaticum TaxID=1927124 RepID=A0A1X0AVV4_9MYCO|nr:Dabb family protein [Mycobacterium aquaticum]ORA33988.1 hypothetical protein BST13_18685 [Mycobacterium aquaticum]
MIDHYVAFRAIPGQAQALSAMLDGFVADISGKLSCVAAISAGVNINETSLRLGYTHGLYVRLRDRGALGDRYGRHPAHLRLLAGIDTVCAERFAIDFVATASTDAEPPRFAPISRTFHEETKDEPSQSV